MNLQQRIDDFLEERANAESDWDEQQSAFTDFVEMELQDQRMSCFDRVKKVAIGMYFSSVRMSDNEILSDFKDACLKAVEEK